LAPDSLPSLPAEVRRWDSGEDDPARTMAAIDSALHSAGVIVGELLSGPTAIAAAATRAHGTPLVSPTATDENIGAMGAGVFQVGPSSYQRGQRLAHVATLAGRRVGVLVSTASSPAFAQGFVDA